MSDDLAAVVQALQDILREPGRATDIASAALAEIVRRKMGIAVCPEGRVPVRIPSLEPGEAGWAKWVIRADPKERGGYMFDGPFLPMGLVSPLPPGAVVLIAVGAGGPKRAIHHATACVVQDDGTLGGATKRRHRNEWAELATMINDYLNRAREIPLLTDRTLAAPPQQYGPPIPPAVLVAATLAYPF